VPLKGLAESSKEKGAFLSYMDGWLFKPSGMDALKDMLEHLKDF
jgi:hypothetical protein